MHTGQIKSRGRAGWRLLIGLLALMLSPYLSTFAATLVRAALR